MLLNLYFLGLSYVVEVLWKKNYFLNKFIVLKLDNIFF